MKSTRILAGVALLVAAITLFRLNDTPPGLYLDETAIALTARSLGRTGCDLNGNFLPLYPISFFDREKPMPINPIYAYWALPFALLGPGEWQARLPSVLWLWAAAAGIGLVAFELTRDRAAALAIGATAALSPWLFVLGRLGWEAVSYPAITAFALWAFLRGARTGSGRDVLLSGTLFGLSIYSYSTARLVAPLTTGALVLLCVSFVTTRRLAWRLLLPLAILAVPLTIHLSLHPGVLTWRFAGEAIWANAGSTAGILKRFASNYASYFSPGFLFLEGDPNLRHDTGSGMLLWIWAPLIALGIVAVWRRRREPGVVAILAGLLLSPVGAALMVTKGPHAIRSIPVFVFWGALAGLGLPSLLNALPRGRAVRAALILLAAVEIGAFLHDYFGDYRARAFSQFDGGRGAVLREAFRRREGRPLIVPGGLHADLTYGVLLAYWGDLPMEHWSPEYLDGIGIHAWRGDWPRGSLIVLGPEEPPVPPPPSAKVIFSVADPAGIRRQRLIAP